MSDPLITQVGQVANTQVDSARFTQPNEMAAAVASEGGNAQARILEQAKAVRRPEEGSESDSTKSEIEKNKDQMLSKRISDVYLKFQIDENDDLTIFVLDKSSKKIVRTIPASDISRMSAGELVELFI